MMGLEKWLSSSKICLTSVRTQIRRTCANAMWAYLGCLPQKKKTGISSVLTKEVSCVS